MTKSVGWYKKYRPKTIDEYIFQNDLMKEKMLSYIESGDMPDLLFHGHHGTGKTTLALLLKENLGIDDVDFLMLNASDENSVDTIRNTIKPFIQTLSLSRFKLVFLDECDALTPQAQSALKSMVEKADQDFTHKNAVFIFSCNKVEKVIPEIRSRCTEYRFSVMDRKTALSVGAQMLVDEGIDISKYESTKEFKDTLMEHLEYTYPDLRSFFNSLEKHFVDNILLPPQVDESEFEPYLDLLSHIGTGDWAEARDLIYRKFDRDDMETIYHFLDSNITELESVEKNKEAQKMIYATLAAHAFRNETIALPQLNLTACIIKICEILEQTKE